MKTIFYNTQHSPIGSFASFTLGAKGPNGGLGLELGKPADQNVFIAVEDSKGNSFSCLPFFKSEAGDLARFNIQAAGKKPGFVLAPLTTGGFPGPSLQGLTFGGRVTWNYASSVRPALRRIHAEAVQPNSASPMSPLWPWKSSWITPVAGPPGE